MHLLVEVHLRWLTFYNSIISHKRFFVKGFTPLNEKDLCKTEVFMKGTEVRFDPYDDGLCDDFRS